MYRKPPSSATAGAVLPPVRAWPAPARNSARRVVVRLRHPRTIGDSDMKRAALLLPAIGALALLPAIGAQAATTSCSQELQQVAQTYHLSLSPPATAQAGNSAEPRSAQSSSSGTASELEKLRGMMSQGQGAGGQSAGE